MGNGLLLLAAFLALSTAANIPSEPDSNRELKMVHVVMRHGIRTPVSTYPKDPHINETFAPNGWGQLTIHGIQELNKFGKFLRGRYGSFLGDHYASNEYYCQSTGVDRALATIMTVNSGLWEPNKDQTWSPKLKWFPIPVFSEPLDADMLLLVRKDCPQYNIELKKIEQSEEVQTKLAKYKDLMTYIEASTGQSMKDFYDIEDVYTTLLAEQSYGLTLPEWTHGYFPEKMVTPAAMSFVLKAYNTKLQKLKGGVLLKKLINDWKTKAAGTISPPGRKAFLYGGHDTTISNLLSALKVFDPQVPNYGIAIMFEFSLDKNTEKYGLEIYLRNSTTIPPYKLQIPGCEKFCPLDKLITLTEKVVPGDWKSECATDDPNYTTVPPTGP